MFQVYNFEMSYQRKPSHEAALKFYLVPPGAYFKPRRQTKSREMILREYALEGLNAFQMPSRSTSLVVTCRTTL